MKKFTFILVFIALTIAGTTVRAQHVLYEYYAGGVIVQLNPDGLSGLIAAAYRSTTGAVWGCGDMSGGAEGVCTGATSKTDGKTNTQIILASGCLEADPDMWWAAPKAAIRCDTSVRGGYDDWYLPAIDQLELAESDNIYTNYPDYVDGKCYWYWASTEYDPCGQYTHHSYNFESCAQVTSHGARGGSSAVRCVRDFDDNDPTSIAKNNKAMDVNVYPTITTDVFNVKFPENSMTALTFELFDISGRMLLSENIAVGSNNIRQYDLSAFATGLYFVKITKTDGSFVKNFKVQKVK